MTATEATFNERLNDAEEAKLDEEFVNRGRDLGADPLPMAELRRGYSDAPQPSAAGEEQAADDRPSPFAGIDREPVRRIRQIDTGARARAQRPSRDGERDGDERSAFDRDYRRPSPVVPDYRRNRQQQPDNKPKRRQIVVHTEETPIDLIDARTGDTVTVYMRSVPTTELPYLDRHDLMLNDVRGRLARVRGRDRKELQQIDRLAADYNAIAEEMTRFVISMPDGLYEKLDVPTLRSLQAEITRMIQGVGAGAQDEDADPNW